MNSLNIQDKNIAVTGIGHAVTDVIKEVPEGFPEKLNLIKGAMTLLETPQQSQVILDAFGGAEQCQSIAGGSAGNTIAALAAFGRATAFIGNIADDEPGRIFAQSLEHAGTKLSRAGEVPQGEISGNCCISVTPDGDRTMATYLGASRALQPAAIDKTLLADSAVVYAEAYLWDDGPLEDVIPSAFAQAKTAGALTALSLSDPFCVARHRDALADFITKGNIDILFGNEEEVTALFPGKNTEELAGILSTATSVTFMTRGANGATVFSGRNAEHVDATAVEHVTDTTGAGDMFAAGALHGLLHKKTYKASAEQGCTAAAHIITRIGGRLSDDFTLAA